jgi:hypothetical protein
MGDGQFKEGAWVCISEEMEHNHPDRKSLAKYKGMFGRLTKR